MKSIGIGIWKRDIITGVEVVYLEHFKQIRIIINKECKETYSVSDSFTKEDFLVYTENLKESFSPVFVEYMKIAVNKIKTEIEKL